MFSLQPVRLSAGAAPRLNHAFLGYGPLKRIATPPRQIRRRFIGRLQEVEKYLIRRFGLPDNVVCKYEFMEIVRIKRRVRLDWCFRETIGLRIGIGIESRIRNSAASGPKPAATDFM